MRGSTLSRRVWIRLSSGWTCSQCRHPSPVSRLPFALPKPLRVHGAARPNATPRGRQNILLLAATGGGAAVAVAGAGFLAVTDNVSTSYEATQRAGRVGAALLICVNE